jgi:Xaa-Pro dipeptidase
VAQVLADHRLVRCTAESAFDAGITRTFLPHGVGHLIGLQTHDVGGQQASPEGGLRPPPEAYPTLRLTRDVEAEQVFTIEPGLYFIPMLLEEARHGPAGQDIDWPRVEALAPCGGIRIEDNVVATADGVRNLTREAFARHG